MKVYIISTFLYIAHKSWNLYLNITCNRKHLALYVFDFGHYISSSENPILYILEYICIPKLQYHYLYIFKRGQSNLNLIVKSIFERIFLPPFLLDFFFAITHYCVTILKNLHGNLSKLPS